MNPIFKIFLAAILGIVIGGVVNMSLIMISGSVIPPPEGVDPSNMESLKENMHLFQPRHFIFPFLAHALGTLVGAFVAAKLAPTQKRLFALGVGAFFLTGGIMSANMLPAPDWFVALDWLGAYFPMAWLGWILASKKYAK